MAKLKPDEIADAILRAHDGDHQIEDRGVCVGCRASISETIREERARGLVDAARLLDEARNFACFAIEDPANRMACKHRDLLMKQLSEAQAAVGVMVEATRLGPHICRKGCTQCAAREELLASLPASITADLKWREALEKVAEAAQRFCDLPEVKESVEAVRGSASPSYPVEFITMVEAVSALSATESAKGEKPSTQARSAAGVRDEARADARGQQPCSPERRDFGGTATGEKRDEGE